MGRTLSFFPPGLKSKTMYCHIHMHVFIVLYPQFGFIDQPTFWSNIYVMSPYEMSRMYKPEFEKLSYIYIYILNAEF